MAHSNWSGARQLLFEDAALCLPLALTDHLRHRWRAAVLPGKEQPTPYRSSAATNCSPRPNREARHGCDWAIRQAVPITRAHIKKTVDHMKSNRREHEAILEPQSQPVKAVKRALDEALPGASAVFRGELADDLVRGFDRDRQLAISAGCIAHLRQTWPAEWRRVRETLDNPVRSRPEFRGVREFRNRLSLAIRVADESADFLNTVAFVSKSVVLLLKPDKSGVQEVKKSDVDRKRIAHEHGVPVDVISRILLEKRNGDCDIQGVLEALSCRALLLKEDEAKRLDKNYKTLMPAELAVAAGTIPITSVPLRFFGLARYHAVEPALVRHGLLPTNARAQRLLNDFLGFVDQRGVERAAHEPLLIGEHVVHIPDSVLRSEHATEREPRTKSTRPRNEG